MSAKFAWDVGEFEIERAIPLTPEEELIVLDAQIDQITAILAVAGGDQDFVDSAPTPLYVRRDVLNVADIQKWAKAQGITDLHDALHVTITYSRTPVDWMEMGQPWSSELIVPAGGPRVFEVLGGALVLSFVATELQYRHEDMIRAGASWDYPKYQPHMTLRYGISEVPPGATPYQGELRLGPEIFEELNP